MRRRAKAKEEHGLTTLLDAVWDRLRELHQRGGIGGQWHADARRLLAKHDAQLPITEGEASEVLDLVDAGNQSHGATGSARALEAAAFSGKPEARAKPVAPNGMQVMEIEVAKIHRRPSNRGGVPVPFPDVADLMASIEACGLSTPIEVRTRSAEQTLAPGHYELVKGERRWTAFRALRRETIPAIVKDLDEAAAAVAVTVDNTQRVDLDPIQRAKAIQNAIAAGVPEDQAAAAAGIPKGAKNALRLLELPPAAQDLVAAGTISQKVALAFVPYKDLAGVMKALAREAADKWCDWPRRHANYEHDVNRVVWENVRPVQPGVMANLGYQRGGNQACAFADEIFTQGATASRKAKESPKTPSPDAIAKYGLVEIRAGNKPQWVATKTKPWDERQTERKKVDQAAAAVTRKKDSAAKKKAGKVANPEAEAQQDRTLQSETERLTLLWLRLLIAEALQPGDSRTCTVAAWVRDYARNRGEGVEPAEDWNVCTALYLGATEEEVSSFRFRNDRPTQWDIARRLIGGDDPLTARDTVECLRAQLQLFPALRDWGKIKTPASANAEHSFLASKLAAHGVVPERYPDLNDDELLAAAHWLSQELGARVLADIWNTTIKEGWTKARESGNYHHAMLREFLGSHNKRQLIRLAAELQVEGVICEGKKLADQVDALCKHHSLCGLKLPKAIAEAAAPPKPKKERGKKAKGKAALDLLDESDEEDGMFDDDFAE